MRVITGSAKGIRLRTLEGLDVRPTTERVKEGMFSSIQFDISGAAVLDLFAGSGQLGIEALSRGAKKAVFVDQSPQSIQIVKENLKKTGLQDYAEIHQKEAELFLQYCPDQAFDFAFLDPPYRKDILQKLLPLLLPKMRKHGKIVCEHEKELEFPEEIFNLRLKKNYVYGKIVVSVWTLAEEEAE